MRRNSSCPRAMLLAVFVSLLLSAYMSLGALSQCPDCGGQVSAEATACPHCGRPANTIEGNRVFRASFADIRECVLLVTTESGVGSASLVSFDGRPYVLSNAHIVEGRTNILFTTVDGVPVPWNGMEVAADRDLVRFSVTDSVSSQSFSSVLSRPSIGDPITVYGNSQGEGAITRLQGKVLGIGPDKIEIDADIVQGNSGSPVLNARGELVGVATYARQASPADWVATGTRFAKTRRFALLLDGVEWDAIDAAEFARHSSNISDAQRLLDDIWRLLPLWFPDAAEYSEVARKVLVGHGAAVARGQYRDLAWSVLLLAFCESYVTCVNNRINRPVQVSEINKGVLGWQRTLRQEQQEKEQKLQTRDDLFMLLYSCPDTFLKVADWKCGYLAMRAKELSAAFDLVKPYMEQALRHERWGKITTWNDQRQNWWSYANASRVAVDPRLLDPATWQTTLRTWTSSSGSQVLASIVDVRGTHLRLRTPDGKVVAISLRALSELDALVVRYIGYQ